MLDRVDARNSIIVALDGSVDQVYGWADQLIDVAEWVKIGMTVFYAAGPRVVTDMVDRGFKVFLDLKMHDIPHQVEGAAYALGKLGVGMITVQASGGAAMIQAAVRGSERGARETGVIAPSVLAVTVLTSMDEPTLRSVGVADSTELQVNRLASLAYEAGAAGIVCSPHEAAAVRKVTAPEALIVTPGVRPVGSNTHDQARIMSPTQAFSAGATHLVIGRPITEHSNPKEGFENILTTIDES